jgi:hypothetical protein
MDVEAGQRARAVERFVVLAGLDEAMASALVDAVLAGGVDHALQVINGTGPVPASVTATRADQLRFVCERAGRLLTQREVEIAFRITASSARAVLTSMQATYAELLWDKFVARMRADARVAPTGTEEGGLTWTVRFSESVTFDTAWAEVQRLGFAGESEASARRIVMPRLVGTKRAHTLQLLGIVVPEGRP